MTDDYISRLLASVRLPGIALEELSQLPAADVAPVVKCKNCDIHQYCKVTQYLGTGGFCSNGAKMNGENNAKD